MSRPFVRIEVKNDLRIVYYRSDGSSAIFLGGARNWRNNNPGNLAYGNGKLMKSLGAIGKAGGFAVFPDSVLKQPAFQEQTLAKAIEIWAPPHENDTDLYKKNIRKRTGLDLNRQLKTLSKDELIESQEGKRKGKVIEVPRSGFKEKKQITKVFKNKKGTIVSYYIENIGWVSKEQGIELAMSGEVDAVVATSSAGNPFLRTRPSVEIVNLEDLG